MNSSLMTRLPTFLRDLKSTFAVSPTADAAIQPLSPPTRQKLQSFVDAIREPLAFVTTSGLLADPFHALKLGRDEVRNAHLLAWLLLWRNGHGLEARLLDELISLVTQNLGLPPIRAS